MKEKSAIISYILPTGVKKKESFKQQQEIPRRDSALSRSQEGETASNRRPFLNGQSHFCLHCALGKAGPPAVSRRVSAGGACRSRAHEAVLSPEHRGTLSSGPHCAGWIGVYLCLAAAQGMHSLNREIEAFSRKNLRKQCTRVTTLTGKKITETWRDAGIHAVEETEPSGGGGCGYVQDLSLDLKVGVIKPWLVLGECIWLAVESLSSFSHITSHFSP